MKKLQNRLWAKLLAGFLLIVLALTGCASGLSCIVLAKSNAFSDGGAELLADFFPDASPAFQRDMDAAMNYYQLYRSRTESPDNYSPQWDEPYLSRFSPENSNFYFAIYDEQGALVFSGGEGETLKNGKTDFGASRYFCQQTRVFEERINERPISKHVSFSSTEAFQRYINEQYARPDTYGFQYAVVDDSDDCISVNVSYTEFDAVTYTLAGYARETLTARDGLQQEYRLLSSAAAHRVLLVVLTALCALAAVVLFVFLMCAAGHASGHEGIHLSWFDRIPLDLLTLLYVLPLALGFDMISMLSGSDVLLLVLTVCAAVLTLYLVMLLSYAATLAARIKAGGWYKNTVIWRILMLLKRLLCRLWRGFRYLCRNLPLCWKTGLIWVGLCLVELLLIIVTGCTESFFVWWLLSRIPLTAVLLMAVINMKKLRDGGEKLASGALTSQIDTSHMLWEFKHHAENLNAIGIGMQKAVEQQTRSERMKAELITNVSHDIKTPLTSIVNYVDLLKKEQIEPEKAREYLEVLDRQSARLKKLTEDLVEASKASTGNLACTLEPTDVNVLLGQVTGEYEGRLESGQLEPILLTDPSAPQILADGRLLWRVFDNLLSNICKYAMPGTRVYLSSEVRDGRVTICFKNISRYALNISADELMERFVRGDSSRSTEGSGLGLSIAQSLTTLQHGTFALTVDGDLFKASVTFGVLS